MKNRRGFTIVELLATITILGILSTIAVVSVTKYLEQAKKSTYADLEKSMMDAARDYLIEYPEDLASAGTDDAPTVTIISLDLLIQNENIDELKDPNLKEGVVYHDELTQNKGEAISNLNHSSYVAVFRFPDIQANLNLSYKVCLRGASYQESGGTLSSVEDFKATGIQGCLADSTNSSYHLATSGGK